MAADTSAVFSLDFPEQDDEKTPVMLFAHAAHKYRRAKKALFALVGAWRTVFELVLQWVAER